MQFVMMILDVLATWFDDECKTVIYQQSSLQWAGMLRVNAIATTV
jgi:hypothetical protein